MPIISLDKDTPKEAVCQVFENVNQVSVSLTVFELITAGMTLNFAQIEKIGKAEG